LGRNRRGNFREAIRFVTYAYVNPLVAVFLGWLVLREGVDRFILAGSAIVVASVVLVTSAKTKARIVTEELAAEN